MERKQGGTMRKELEELGRQLSRFGIACSTVQLFDVLAAIEKRLDDLKKRPGHSEIKALLQRERDHRHRQIAQIDKALSAHRFEDEHGEIEKDLDYLCTRVSNLECPSPMFLDAMNRLHALDGQGNGDVDPPAIVFTLTERVNSLEKEVTEVDEYHKDFSRDIEAKVLLLIERVNTIQRSNKPGIYALLETNARLDALEKLHYKGVCPEAHNYPEPAHNEPTPPDVCEGCAEIGDCKGDHDPAFLLARDNPDCYVEKKTCGTCAHPYRKSSLENIYVLLCYEMNGQLGFLDGQMPERRSHDDPACSNHKPLKVTSE
jgi:hypothetical protein